MAAVKRARKLLDIGEKRKRAEKEQQKRRPGQQQRQKHKEERRCQSQDAELEVGDHVVVLVKGSGRAVEQAGRVGEWFRRHAADNEGSGGHGGGRWMVNVKASSIKVIDDIVEVSSAEAGEEERGKSDNSQQNDEHETEIEMDGSKIRLPKERTSEHVPISGHAETAVLHHDNRMNMDSRVEETIVEDDQRTGASTDHDNIETSSPRASDYIAPPRQAPGKNETPIEQESSYQNAQEYNARRQGEIGAEEEDQQQEGRKRKRKRQKKQRKDPHYYDEENIPEARSRYIDAVEIRISVRV